MAEDPTIFQQPTNINWRGEGYGTVEYGGGDKSLVVFFYNKAVPQPGKSKAAGTPVYENVTFVRMAPPGEKLNIVDRPAVGNDARRFPLQWAQFEKNAEQIPEGTPVDLLYPENPAIAATLRASGIHTIEQCAEMSAHALDNVGMGSQTWQNAAQKYMKAVNKGIKASQYRQDVEERDRQISFLTKQVEELKNTVQQMRNETMARANIAAQTLMAGAMGRPTHQAQVAFDEQTAMIEAAGRASRPPPAPQARQRRRIGG